MDWVGFAQNALARDFTILGSKNNTNTDRVWDLFILMAKWYIYCNITGEYASDRFLFVLLHCKTVYSASSPVNGYNLKNN